MEKEPIKGNKGEWSEIYTLFKLLGDGKVHAGDADMNKLNLYYPILNVIREECKKYEYQPKIDQHIVVIDENGKLYAKISMDSFIKESSYLYDKILHASKGPFAVPQSELFMNQIGCTKLKAPSKDKSDIRIVIHDLRTNMTPLLGFSIKSQLGHPSTLLNPGVPTNILYKVDAYKLSDKEIKDINSIQKHIPRLNEIIKKGCELTFSDIEHTVFKNNLLFLDCCMPKFVAECLLIGNLCGEASTIKGAVETIAKKNPFNFAGSDVLSFYEHKMKVLLLDAALGMTPAKEWKGRYDANGGYLVVRKDGEVVCYHFYNRNDVEDYLYNNTRFDNPSRSRYGFGELFRKEDGNVYIRLNLQIRFKK